MEVRVFAASALAELRHGNRNTGVDTLKRFCITDSGIAFAAMRLYALVEAGDPEAIDVYLCEQDAQRALEDCLSDEPDWQGRLCVEEIELSADRTSLN